MLIVYTTPVSLYCAKTRIALRIKGLDWDARPPLGGYGSDAYKTIVPSGNIPALVDGDFVLADSEAIAEYLEEAYPAPPMLPKNVRARAICRERGRFHDTRLEPAVRGLFGQVARSAREGAVLKVREEEISRRLAQFGQRLGEAPVAEPFPSIGDCGYLPTFMWIDALATALDLTIDWPDAVRAYRAALEAVPEIAAERDFYAPAIQPWIDQKAAT